MGDPLNPNGAHDPGEPRDPNGAHDPGEPRDPNGAHDPGEPRDPRPERPGVRGYGIPETEDGLLPWAWAREHLERAITYWIATTRPDSRPHSVPTWGAWLDDQLWFEGGLGTRRARNLAANPHATASVHVDDDTAVIVEGVVELRSDPEPALVARLVDAFGKYRDTRWGYVADPANWRSESGGGLWALRPKVVLGWSRFPEDATRWRLDR